MPVHIGQITIKYRVRLTSCWRIKMGSHQVTHLSLVGHSVSGSLWSFWLLSYSFPFPILLWLICCHTLCALFILELSHFFINICCGWDFLFLFTWDLFVSELLLETEWNGVSFLVHRQPILGLLLLSCCLEGPCCVWLTNVGWCVLCLDVGLSVVFCCCERMIVHRPEGWLCDLVYSGFSWALGLSWCCGGLTLIMICRFLLLRTDFVHRESFGGVCILVHRHIVEGFSCLVHICSIMVRAGSGYVLDCGI